MLEASILVFSVGNVVDLLDGGEIVAKGRIMNVDPDSMIHGQLMPINHVRFTLIWDLKGSIYIPYVPPHEQEFCTLNHVLGCIIMWPRGALAKCP